MPGSGEAYEIIEARNDLRAKVREIRVRSPEDDPVARAEAALGALSQHFDGWMADEVARMVERRDAWLAAGAGPGEARDGFHRAVHDLKGQASTLGFPLAARVAASLCTLLERTDPETAIPEPLVASHVEAIRAIFREKARDESDRIGAALAESLDRLTEGFVGEHGRPENPEDVD